VALEDGVVEVLACVDVRVFIVAAGLVTGIVEAGGDEPPDLEKQLPDMQVRSNQVMTVFS
jgi:hypothetical protein